MAATKQRRGPSGPAGRPDIAARFARSGRRSRRGHRPRPRRDRGARRALSGSFSVSARWRSRMVGAVRCPNSASNTDARARRLPARRDRARSAPDTVHDDRDRADPQAEQTLDGAARPHRAPGAASAPSGWPGRAMTVTRTSAVPSRIFTSMGDPARIAAPAGPPRPMRRTPGTSSVASRTIVTTTLCVTSELWVLHDACLPRLLAKRLAMRSGMRARAAAAPTPTAYTPCAALPGRA